MSTRDRETARLPVEERENAKAYSAWYRNLDPLKKQAIRDLHRINPWWNLVGIAFAVLWWLAALLIVSVPSWLVRLPAYFAIGVLIHGMANFMHEGIHGTLFRDKRKNRWFGFVMGAPALFSVTAYGVNHLLHHRFNRTKDDPDEITNVTKDPRLLQLFFYGWILFGTVAYSLRLPYSAIHHGSRSERSQVVLEQVLLALMVGSLFYFSWRGGWLPLLVQVWLIPLIVTASIGNMRGWAEHVLTVRGHPLTETRTVTSTRWFSFFHINLNYHLEHHLFPRVPWYNLPKVHSLLLDDYRAAGASVYGSYTRFLFDAFRQGLRGVT
jgi:fatty acid desaturase